MGVNKNYIFDFDSTFISVEGLDVLAEISLSNNSKKSEILQEVQKITDLGIDGEITTTQSLESRLKLLNANKNHLDLLVGELKQKVSLSIQKHRDFFKKYSENIYIVSAGFKEFIVPIVADYNIPSERVFANTFEFDENENIIGFDRGNPLSKNNGKIECLQNLNLKGEIYMIGDGYSDYITKKAGVADKFFAYTENIEREKTIKNTDYIINDFGEFLKINNIIFE